MDNIEINVKINGKEVPLSNISTETFNKIRNAENRATIVYKGDVFESPEGIRWLFFYDYTSQGFNLVCTSTDNADYGQTYSGDSICCSVSQMNEGISREVINEIFYALSEYKHIQGELK